MSKSRDDKYQGPKDKLQQYNSLIDMHPEFERKGGTMPYTSRNGHMYSFLDKDGTMGLRLPSEARQVFIAKYDTSVMEQYGRIMKEYVVVPDELLTSPEILGSYMRISYAYVGSLKPKPTRRD